MIFIIIFYDEWNMTSLDSPPPWNGNIDLFYIFSTLMASVGLCPGHERLEVEVCGEVRVAGTVARHWVALSPPLLTSHHTPQTSHHLDTWTNLQLIFSLEAGSDLT